MVPTSLSGCPALLRQRVLGVVVERDARIRASFNQSKLRILPTTTACLRVQGGAAAAAAARFCYSSSHLAVCIMKTTSPGIAVGISNVQYMHVSSGLW